MTIHNILEEEVEKIGTTVPEAIQREHFDIAIKKIKKHTPKSVSFFLV